MKPSDQLKLEDFEMEDDMYEGEVSLEEWDNLFQCEGPYILRFHIDEDQHTKTFTKIQKIGYDFLVEHAKELLEPILKELLEQWPAIQDMYGYEGQPEAERQQQIPDVTNTNGFFSLLYPTHVHIFDFTCNGQPYIGIEFSCSWDREHAFGAMLCGNRIVEIGGADTAFLQWIAKGDLQKQLET